ncbi:MAG: hypothetical protein RJS97_02745 [Parvibaculaceae bacterium]
MASWESVFQDDPKQPAFDHASIGSIGVSPLTVRYSVVRLAFAHHFLSFLFKTAQQHPMKHLSMSLLAFILVGCQGEQSKLSETTSVNPPGKETAVSAGGEPMASPDEDLVSDALSVEDQLTGMDATVGASPQGGIRSVTFMGSTVSPEALELVVDIPELVILSLSGTSVGDTEMERIGKLTNLKVLLIGGTQVTDDGLVHLSSLNNLERLGLGDTRISDTGLNHLHGLKNLKMLFLGETMVTDEGVAAFVAAVPECQIER